MKEKENVYENVYENETVAHKTLLLLLTLLGDEAWECLVPLSLAR